MPDRARGRIFAADLVYLTNDVIVLGFRSHAHGSNLAPGGISDAAPIGGRIAIFSICKCFRAQRRDGWICRFLYAAYACVSHLPFSAPRSVERLSCLEGGSPENLPDRDVQKAQNNRAPEGRRESLNVKSRHQ